ncbi:MAG: 30S ribosomal protein S20 [Planctomycetota bacterium]|nr:30S ribosomal protein S20 [Planctomycetota bacterium]
MAHSKSAQKRIRQNAKHNARNRWRKVSMRTAIKDFREKLLHGTPEETQEAFRKACAIIDKTAQKGVIHRNTAARQKSRLNARLKAKAAA